MQSATTRMRWFLRFMPSSRDPLVFPPHQSPYGDSSYSIGWILFVCFADISPKRGITLHKGDGIACTDHSSLPLEGKVARPQAETDEVVPAVCTEYL